MINKITLFGAIVALSATISTAHAGIVSPFALYTFEEGNANDSSGNNLHGTVLDVFTTFPNAGSGRDGVGRAVQIRPLFGDSGIELPISGNSADFPELSIAVWANFGFRNAVGKLVSADDGGFDRTVGLDFRAAGTPLSENNYSAYTGAGVIGEDGTVTEGIWQFIVATWSGTETKLYIDGALAATGTDNGSVTANTFHIGSNPGFTEDWDGRIDDVAFYSSVLSANDVTHLFNDVNYSTPTTVNPVPLPAGLPLLFAGLGGLAFLRRKSA